MNCILEIKHGKDSSWSEAITLSGIENDVISVSGGTETATNEVVMYSGIEFSPGTQTSGLAYKMIFTALKKSIAYYVRLYVTLNGQNSQYSNEQAVQFDNTADTTRPTISVQPSASQITTNSALISWGVGESGLTNTVEYWRGAGAHTTVTATSTTIPNVALSGLTAGVLYDYIVRSLDQAGNYSQSVSNFTTTTSSTTTGTYIFQRRFGGTAFNIDNAFPLAIKEDRNGDAIVVGSFQKTVDFGGGSLTATPSANNGGDIFIAKYSGSSGVYLWSKRIGSDLDEGAISVAVDSTNNILVAGYFQGTVDFGGVTLTNAGSSDIFVAKFASSGSLLWAKRFGGTPADVCRAMVLDAANNILISGTYGFYGTAVDFGGGPLPLPGGGNFGGTDVFVAKLSPAGNHIWSDGYGGLGHDIAMAIAVNGNGDVAVVGDFQQTASFGGGLLANAGGRDVFAAKYSGVDGRHLWSRSGGGTGEDLGKAVGFDPSGNVAVTGQFDNTANFGGTGMSPANGLTGMFLAKYSEAGTHLWSRGFSSMGHTGSVSPKGLAVDSLGNIVVTGGVSGNAIFDGIYLGYGTPAIMLVKFTTDGSTTWAKFYDGLQTDYGTSVAVGAANNILATGSFSYSVNFGGGLMNSPGGFDGFIAKFTP